jgi:hypothetical protein
MRTLQQKIVHLFIIGIFVSLYFLVATISMINSVAFFDLAHDGIMSWSLAIGFEMGAAASLAAILILDKTNKTMVWGLFILLTAFQMMANSYHAFINLEDYMGWIELFGLEEEEPIFQKRILSVVSGAILPIVALGFIKSLTDYIKPNDQVELITDTSPEPLNPQPYMDKETEESVQDLKDWDSTLNDGLDDEDDWDEDHAHDMALNAMVADLSEDDLEELFEVNENPPAPNEELKRAAEEYKESVSGSDEVDVKIDGDTTYVTTKKPTVVKSKNAPL